MQNFFRKKKNKKIIMYSVTKSEVDMLTWGELERRFRKRRGRGRLLSRLLRLLLLVLLLLLLLLMLVVLVLLMLRLLHLMLLQAERTAAPALRGQLGDSFPVGAALERGAGHPRFPIFETEKTMAEGRGGRRSGAGRGDATEPKEEGGGAKGGGAAERGRVRSPDAFRADGGLFAGAAPLDAFDSVGIERRAIRRRSRDHNTVEAEPHCYQPNSATSLEHPRNERTKFDKIHTSE